MKCTLWYTSTAATHACILFAVLLHPRIRASLDQYPQWTNLITAMTAIRVNTVVGKKANNVIGA